MQKRLIKMLTKLMRETADKIDAGNCEITADEAMDLLSVLSHESLSKDQACSFLNLSRSKFDDLVREGKLPKGRKVRGFKELRFWKDELNNAIIKIENEKSKF